MQLCHGSQHNCVSARGQAKLESEQKRRVELEAQTAEQAARLVETQREVQRDHDAVAAKERAESEAARKEAAARAAAMKALQAEQLAQACLLARAGLCA